MASSARHFELSADVVELRQKLRIAAELGGRLRQGRRWRSLLRRSELPRGGLPGLLGGRRGLFRGGAELELLLVRLSVLLMRRIRENEGEGAAAVTTPRGQGKRDRSRTEAQQAPRCWRSHGVRARRAGFPHHVHGRPVARQKLGRPEPRRWSVLSLNGRETASQRMSAPASPLHGSLARMPASLLAQRSHAEGRN